MEKKEKIRLVVWGTGGLAANTLSCNAAWLAAVEIVCFVSNSHKMGEEEVFEGKSVIAPEELANIDWDYITIFSTYIDEIREQIIHELKISEDRIVSLEKLAQKVVEYNSVNIIGKDVVLYGENYDTDTYVYHLRKRVKSLKVVCEKTDEKISGVETLEDISEIRHTEFDFILLLDQDEEEEARLRKQIHNSGYNEDSKLLKLSQWSCNLALEHKILQNDSEKTYYAIVGRPTWGLMALFTEFMRASVFAMEQGYIPFIDMQNSVNMYLEAEDFGKKNAWEYFFTQPKEIAGKSIEEIYRNENVMIASKFFRASRNRNVVDDKKALENLRNIYHNHFKMQETALKEFCSEYQRIFGEDRDSVVGVIFRGTDYKNMNPANHYIQPELEEFVSFCDSYMQERNCKRLFIATEDAEVLEYFKGVFGEKLLYTNQLRYSDTGNKFLYQITNKRENDKYIRGIEYLTALYCLTKCDYLISGRNAGLNGVLILKENEYKDTYIFNKGKYANSNQKFR